MDGIKTKVLNNRGGRGQLALAKVPDIFRDQAKRAVLATAFEIQTDARDHAPVDTGRLRSSIQIDVAENQLGAKIGTNVEYAGYVEFGTRKMPARPFLFPACERGKPAFRKRIRAAYEAAKAAGQVE